MSDRDAFRASEQRALTVAAPVAPLRDGLTDRQREGDAGSVRVAAVAGPRS